MFFAPVGPAPREEGEPPDERGGTGRGRRAPAQGRLVTLFAVSFVFFCLVPLIILFAIYLNLDDAMAGPFSKSQLGLIIVIMGATSLFLFYSLSRTLYKLNLLSLNLKRALKEKFDTSLILELAEEQGEVAEMARSVEELVTRSKQDKFLKAGLLRHISRLLVKVEEGDEMYQQLVSLACRMTSSSVGFLLFLEQDRWEMKKTHEMSAGFAEAVVGLLKELGLESSIGDDKVLNLPEVSLPAPDEDPAAGARHLLCVCFTRTAMVNRWGILGVINPGGEARYQTEHEWILSYLGQIMKALSFLSQSVQEFQKSCQDAFYALLHALEARDPYLFNRSKLVNGLCLKVAEKMDLSEKDREILGMASHLYDIGMLAVPDRILLKNEALSDKETALMQVHVEMGVRILHGIKSIPPEVLEIVRAHHERVDGKGYPYSLKGDEIPLASRIIHVCQAYEAMTSSRPYRPGMKTEAALDLMRMEKGTQFDPYVLRIFETVALQHQRA